MEHLQAGALDEDSPSRIGMSGKGTRPTLSTKSLPTDRAGPSPPRPTQEDCNDGHHQHYCGDEDVRIFITEAVLGLRQSPARSGELLLLASVTPAIRPQCASSVPPTNFAVHWTLGRCPIRLSTTAGPTEQNYPFFTGGEWTAAFIRVLPRCLFRTLERTWTCRISQHSSL